MTRLGVLGWPVAHSRSPAMHNAALRELGLEGWSYQRLPVPPELFEETVRALGGAGFLGANVTIPHKEAAFGLADDPSEAARAIGAANTLTFAPDGRIAAENTDAPGLIGAMERAGHHPRGLTAMVLGAGGSARATVWALREAGAREVAIHSRNRERAQELARAQDARAVALPERADILINCTPVGLVRPASGGRATSTNCALRTIWSVGTRMWSIWSTEKAPPGCSPLRASRECPCSTGSRCSWPRARSASNSGPAGQRRSRSCVALADLRSVGRPPSTPEPRGAP